MCSGAGWFVPTFRPALFHRLGADRRSRTRNDETAARFHSEARQSFSRRASASLSEWRARRSHAGFWHQRRRQHRNQVPLLQARQKRNFANPFGYTTRRYGAQTSRPPSDSGLPNMSLSIREANACHEARESQTCARVGLPSIRLLTRPMRKSFTSTWTGTWRFIRLD
jgi:hypothetical protein